MKKIVFLLFVVIAAFGIMGDSIYQAVHDPPGEMTEVIYTHDVAENSEVFVYQFVNRCGEAPCIGPGDLFTYSDASQTKLQNGISPIINNTFREAIEPDNSTLKLPAWRKNPNRENHIVMQRGELPRIRHV